MGFTSTMYDHLSMISFFYTILLLNFHHSHHLTVSSASSHLDTYNNQNHHHQNQWPLRYHNSPWLHKDFIIRPEDEPDASSVPEQSNVNCDENGNVVNNDGEIESVGSCPSKNECDFTPSAHCVLELKKRREHRADEHDFSADELLARLSNPKLYGNIR